MSTVIESVLNIAPIINTCLLLGLLLGVPVYLRRHADLEARIKGQQERLDGIEQHQQACQTREEQWIRQDQRKTRQQPPQKEQS